MIQILRTYRLGQRGRIIVVVSYYQTRGKDVKSTKAQRLGFGATNFPISHLRSRGNHFKNQVAAKVCCDYLFNNLSPSIQISQTSLFLCYKAHFETTTLLKRKERSFIIVVNDVEATCVSGGLSSFRRTRMFASRIGVIRPFHFVLNELSL